MSGSSVICLQAKAQNNAPFLLFTAKVNFAAFMELTMQSTLHMLQAGTQQPDEDGLQGFVNRQEMFKQMQRCRGLLNDALDAAKQGVEQHKSLLCAVYYAEMLRNVMMTGHEHDWIVDQYQQTRKNPDCWNDPEAELVEKVCWLSQHHSATAQSCRCYTLHAL